MAKFRSLKNSFIAGEISPSALGRVDLPQYQHGCEILKNMIPLTSGGTYRRPGSFFEKSFAAVQYAAPRIIPFVVSQDEAYAIILSRDFTAPAFTEGTLVIRRTTGTASRGTDATIESAFTPWTHPWIGLSPSYYREYEQVQFVQSVDVMTLVHPSYRPMRLHRIATDDFYLDFFDAGLAGTALMNAQPFRPQNTTVATLTPSATTVGVGRTLTASANFFDPKHVGAYFKLNHAGTIGFCKVTGYTSATVVTIEIYVAFGSTAATAAWWESAWSDYRGWPRTIEIFANRVCYGGNATDRDSIWMSQTNNFDVMSVATAVDPRSSPTGSDPFTFQLPSNRLNIIQWLSADQTLIAGTLGPEWVVSPIDVTAGIKATNVQAVSKSAYGSSFHPAQRFGEEIVFCTASNNELKSLIFSELQQSYVAEPIQLLFDSYPKPEFCSKVRRYRQFAWDESRDTLWCVDTAGNLFGMTRDRRLQVTAWHSHQMGGFDDSDIEINNDQTERYKQLYPGSVISMAVIPNPANGLNDVWLTVRRKINGAYVYHIERMIGKEISSDTVVNSSLTSSGNYFVDACITYPNAFLAGVAETHSFSGAGHLEGETLAGTSSQVIGGSSETGVAGITTITETAVAAGVITLVQPYPTDYETTSYEMTFGLPFTPVVKPVRLEAGSQIGTAQGAIKRIHKTFTRFLKTLSAKIGPDEDTLETINFREGSTPMGSSPELFTGTMTTDFSGDYDQDGYVYLTTDQALPFAVSSIIAEGMTSDG